jgi:hypothetical protein
MNSVSGPIKYLDSEVCYKAMLPTPAHSGLSRQYLGAHRFLDRLQLRSQPSRPIVPLFVRSDQSPGRRAA